MTQKVRDKAEDLNRPIVDKYGYAGITQKDLLWLCTTIEKLCDVVDSLTEGQKDYIWDTDKPCATLKEWEENG